MTIPTKAHIKFEAHDGEIMSARWDYAGRYFATAGADRKIKIWEISKGISCELKSTLTGSNAAVMGIDFDTSGTMILGSSNDFATRVWTIEDCRLRHTLTGHSGKVLSAKFLGDATRVVSGSHDRTLKVWRKEWSQFIILAYLGLGFEEQGLYLHKVRWVQLQ